MAMVTEARITKLDLVLCLGLREKRLDRVLGRIWSLTGSISSSVGLELVSPLRACSRRMKRLRIGA